MVLGSRPCWSWSQFWSWWPYSYHWSSGNWRQNVAIHHVCAWSWSCKDTAVVVVYLFWEFFCCCCCCSFFKVCSNAAVFTADNRQIMVFLRVKNIYPRRFCESSAVSAASDPLWTETLNLFNTLLWCQSHGGGAAGAAAFSRELILLLLPLLVRTRQPPYIWLWRLYTSLPLKHKNKVSHPKQDYWVWGCCGICVCYCADWWKWVSMGEGKGWEGVGRFLDTTLNHSPQSQR